jgi:hypothetical protein
MGSQGVVSPRRSHAKPDAALHALPGANDALFGTSPNPFTSVSNIVSEITTLAGGLIGNLKYASISAICQ